MFAQMYLAQRLRTADQRSRIEGGLAQPPWKETVTASRDPHESDSVRWASVLGLGLTSMTADISTEMIAAVVPLYLLTRLDYSFARFGALDASLQLSVVLLGLMGAILADRFRRHRALAGLGYGGSVVAKIGLALSAGSLPLMLLGDRVAKGVRTAPRDALLADCSGPGHRGRVFGIHRSLDTAGALIGPVVAFALLSRRPGRYDMVWVASAAIAVISVLIFMLLVEPPVNLPEDVLATRRATPGIGELTRAALSPQLRRIWLVAFLAGTAMIGDSFVLLVLRQRFDISGSMFPLLLSGASVAYLTLAFPIGALADRRNPNVVLLAGLMLLPLIYGVLLAHMGRAVTLVLVLVLVGSSTAALDGVLVVVTTRVVGPEFRAGALAVVAVGMAAGRWFGTASFGFVWSTRGRSTALVWAALLSITAGLLACGLLFGRVLGQRHTSLDSVD